MRDARATIVAVERRSRWAGRWLCGAALLLTVGCGGGDDGGDDSAVTGGSSAAGGSGSSVGGTGGGSSDGGTGGGSSGSGTGGGSSGSGTGGGSSGSGTGGSSPGGGAAGTGGDYGPCEPAELGEWSPPAYVAARSMPGSCSSAEIARYYDDCLAAASCAEFEADGAAADCGACMNPTPLDADRYGPILELAPRPFYRWESNLAGCIEILGEVACAHKIAAAQACARDVCTEGCGVTHPDYSSCIADARAGVCAEYEAAAVCIMDPANATRCVGGDFRALVLAYGEVYCG